MRRLSRAPVSDPNTLVVQTIIDEPNLWSEKTPFVYEGFAELHEDGACQDRAPVSVGFKMA